MLRPSTENARPVVLVLAAALAGLMPSRGDAQLYVCNRTVETISVAVAVPNTGGWTTAGWYNAAPGSCVTPVSGSLRYRYYYVHGRSSSGTWGRDRRFCILRGSAFQVQNGGDCESSGFTGADFTTIDTGSESTYWFNLTDAAPNGSQTVHSAIDAIRVSWRESIGIENTWVMQLRNDLSYGVSFSVRCYTRDGGRSTSFSVYVASKGMYEIGFLEGWEGNFVRGEYCDAYHGDEQVWRAYAGLTRLGR